MAIGYTGEMWRLGAADRTDRLDFQLSHDATSLTTGAWTDVDSLDFTSPVTAIPTGALDGNLAANQTGISSSITSLAINPGATFWLRWTDLNATGSDDGLAVDNFSLTARGTTQEVPEAGGGLFMVGLSALGLLGFSAVSRFQRRRLDGSAGQGA